ncbi:hypothetical protein COY65_03080 [Candidatus Jorgensenbacteria bacterium CG_4_10_14_0_8_um_filter_39_13]|uniref:Four helix bundle protein n=2 Tax=Candidatus Joergenseniibacteriota TaxID=1752739 RepID=A0A2M7RG47_9BACT|nr:MAG: hypothetical protein COV54_02595 [Candidatus Jorgensenbacteria bacterium CG11_big_fil_rev_8_21_14_0_20_38_23]PIV13131.1 MAG: hypothetical protein COS46_01965 [Candidatus Jorgensenbacteria bacterium CG03_land_8_20_14_0_80_38_39]PIW97848.1 MAG: hypothetical protein COZ81_00425 [Candidatus Jorgensenbacteria bacterium CG_4_8_14_3_um_filter_38_10]PIY95531.1 MAG: hypothetical protein COY65_03080 [Candidatus Jorgensenbacteria bacterium CG_4_10_14_0_8_um_filter_39_13]PJA94916.1 MAG: hypothetica
MQNTIFKLSKYKQILNVASELLRAKEWSNNQEMFQASLERALGLVDLLLTDPKWQDNYYFLLVLREEISKVYVKKQSIADMLKVL